MVVYVLYAIVDGQATHRRHASTHEEALEELDYVQQDIEELEEVFDDEEPELEPIKVKRKELS